MIKQIITISIFVISAIASIAGVLNLTSISTLQGFSEGSLFEYTLDPAKTKLSRSQEAFNIKIGSQFVKFELDNNIKSQLSGFSFISTSSQDLEYIVPPECETISIGVTIEQTKNQLKYLQCKKL